MAEEGDTPLRRRAVECATTMLAAVMGDRVALGAELTGEAQLRDLTLQLVRVVAPGAVSAAAEASAGAEEDGSAAPPNAAAVLPPVAPAPPGPTRNNVSEMERELAEMRAQLQAQAQASRLWLMTMTAPRLLSLQASPPRPTMPQQLVLLASVEIAI